jgi:alanine-glyoxylate transaminase/serine-glyoxylate transaminase/serine-pyruvate transaminase
LDEYNLEIGGGLGLLAGKIWRVGLMGYSSSETSVLYFLTALEQALREQGFEVARGAGITAAKEVYSGAR